MCLYEQQIENEGEEEEGKREIRRADQICNWKINISTNREKDDR